jgi:hypothetical protein
MICGICVIFSVFGDSAQIFKKTAKQQSWSCFKCRKPQRVEPFFPLACGFIEAILKCQLLRESELVARGGVLMGVAMIGSACNRRKVQCIAWELCG